MIFPVFPAEFGFILKHTIMGIFYFSDLHYIIRKVSLLLRG